MRISDWSSDLCSSDLDSRGLLNAHRRGIASYGQASDCAGSGKAPPRLTPYASRAVAFKSAPRRVTCPDCGQQVALMPAGGTRLTLRSEEHTSELQSLMRIS